VSVWVDFPLSEVVELVGGGTPKTTVTEYWNGNIPRLSVVDFNTGRKYISDTEKNITNKGFENSSTKLLNAGDIILSARGTVGAMAILTKPMTFNQSCYGLRGIKGKSETDFFYYLVKDAVGGLQQIAHGGVFDTITRDTFKDITLPIPPIPEQKAIAAVLSSLDDKIDLLHRQNLTLEAMAETLFRQWFVEETQEDWEEGCLGGWYVYQCS
jgi:type I restriction enzyme, S subunit